MIIKVTSREYLDKRRPEFLDAETYGRVRYNALTGLVEIADMAIQREFAVTVSTDVLARAVP